MFNQIAVVGAGTMGNGIAHVFAQHGYKVNLIDLNPEQLEKAIATIRKNLDRQVAKEFFQQRRASRQLIISLPHPDWEKG